MSGDVFHVKATAGAVLSQPLNQLDGHADSPPLNQLDGHAGVAYNRLGSCRGVVPVLSAHVLKATASAASFDNLSALKMEEGLPR